MKKSLKNTISMTVLALAIQPLVSAQSLSTTAINDATGALGLPSNPLLGDLTGGLEDSLRNSLNDANSGLSEASTASVDGFDLSGGVPGLDGLNLSSDALANAFDAPELQILGAVLSPDGNGTFAAQFNDAFSARLPGLGSDEEELLAELPGLDGLPVALPR